MNRISLGVVMAVLLTGLPEGARAADPPTGSSGVDPFAPPAEGSPPASTDDQEAAVLGAPARPAPSTQPPSPAPPAAAPARRPAAASRPRRAQANDEESLSAAAPTSGDQSGVALELSTSGFASGDLVSGLFVGGRTTSGLILGGFLNYGLTSINSAVPNAPEITTSVQFIRLGFGVRHSFVQSGDHLVDLYGAADASFDYRSAEVPSSTTNPPTQTVSASGFSLALGPGLRLWVHEQIAIGYVGRLRLSYLSGEAGALTSMVNEDTTNGSTTTIGFEGLFQLLGVF